MLIAWIGFGAFCVLALFTLFPTWKHRLIGFGLLVPLVALASAIYSAGQRPRTESLTAQDDPTVFGDGAHEAGASHAAGSGVAGQGAPEHGAKHTTPTSQHPSIGLTLAGPKAMSGLTWPDPGTEYTSQTLWNRIDGGAEAYTKAGMRRALFATARSGDTDIDVQVFDFITPEAAGAYYDSVSRSPESKAFTAGDAAVLWRGGGEVRRARYYARVVLSTAEPTPEAEAAVNGLLQRIAANDTEADTDAKPEAPPAEPSHEAGAAPAGDRPPTPVAPADTPSAPTDAAEATAKRLDVGVHLVKQYGLTGPEIVSVGPHSARVIRAQNRWSAAAWAGTLLTERPSKTRPFDGTADGEHIRTRGPAVVLADNAEAADTVADSLKEEDLPALGTLGSRATDIQVQLGGWNGRRALGGVLTGTLADDSDVFIATPGDVDAAWTALLESYNVATPAERQHATVKDEYQGDVLFVRGPRGIVGVAAYEDAAAARGAADVLLADL